MMAKVVDVKEKKWVKFLPFVVAAYNNLPKIRGFRPQFMTPPVFFPNFLLFGRELVAAVDIAFGCPRPPSCSASEYAYLTVRSWLRHMLWYEFKFGSSLVRFEFVLCRSE